MTEFPFRCWVCGDPCGPQDFCHGCAEYICPKQKHWKDEDGNDVTGPHGSKAHGRRVRKKKARKKKEKKK